MLLGGTVRVLAVAERSITAVSFQHVTTRVTAMGAHFLAYYCSSSLMMKDTPNGQKEASSADGFWNGKLWS
jgi:hypothetical protein